MLTDRDSALHCLTGKLSDSKNVKEQPTVQFNLTLPQQNEQTERLRAEISQACSHEPLGFGETGGHSVVPRKTSFSQKRRYNEEQLHFCPILSCYSCTVVCLRVCRHGKDIRQSDRLKFDEFSGSIDQLVRFVRMSNLVKKGNCTFAATFRS
jgi:hypothetical protein